MRQQPQNVLERPCVRARAWFPINQCLDSALWLTNQIAAAASVYSPVRCARAPFPCRIPASRFTYVLVTVNTQSLSSQRLPFLYLGAQLILETTRGY